jgi:hypothetical protein
MEKKVTHLYHRFLDEAGDTTFYGKGNTPIVGTEGVSHSFILGMVTINEPLEAVRQKIMALQQRIANDSYFDEIPSIQKKKATYGYFLHAKDDIPEVRKMAFELIGSIDCHFEAIVARKIYDLYERKHNGKEAEFYADLLSHLLQDKLGEQPLLVLNIAERKKCTTHQNLTKGLEKAIARSASKNSDKGTDGKVVFNVQQPTTEPILNLADYFCWAIQRVFERGETRYYNFIKNKTLLIHDIYDFEKAKTNENIYGQQHALTSKSILAKNSK